MTNRFYVLKLYGRRVIAPVLDGHAEGEPSFPRRQLARVRKLMIRENSGQREDPHARQWLESALQRNQTLQTVYSFMQRLKALSAQTTGKTESDLKRLQAWWRSGSERPSECSATSLDNCRRTHLSRLDCAATRFAAKGAAGARSCRLAGKEAFRGGNHRVV